MLTLLKEIAVQNVDSPSSIARLSNIMDGVDGAGAFNFSQETEAIQVEDNQRRQISELVTMDLRVIQDDGQSAIIDAIQANQSKALITGYTPNGFVVFPDPVLLTRNKQYDGILASAVFATVRGTPGFAGSPRKRFFHAGRNLLGIFDVTTVDPRNRKIFFPFPGVELTASADSGTVGVQYFDVDNNSVGGTLGSTPHTTTVPENTVYVQFGSPAPPVNAMITIDGSTNFEL